jgi:hypothetical protein
MTILPITHYKKKANYDGTNHKIQTLVNYFEIVYNAHRRNRLYLKTKYFIPSAVYFFR